MVDVREDPSRTLFQRLLLIGFTAFGQWRMNGGRSS